MVGSEGQVGANQHGGIGGKEVGGDEIDNALERAALAECRICGYSMGQVRVPKVELVVGEPFIKGVPPGVIVLVTS